MSDFRKQALSALLNLVKGKPLPSDFNTYDLACKNLVLQTCRYFYQLESILQYLQTSSPKDPYVFTALIMGLCELHCLNKSAHACINETVELVKKAGFRSASGFVNAILRKSIREKELWQKELGEDEAYVYAHPQWLIDIIKSTWPEHWQSILDANNQHPPMSLRVNQQKISRQDYLKILNVAADACLYSPQGIILHKPVGIDNLAHFFDAYVSVQDEAAQLAASFLDLKPKLRILDACAAPGGKIAHILESVPDSDCSAIEYQAARFEKLEASVKRLQLSVKLIQADATAVSTWWDGQTFDRILIDAPCSGTGVIRRHPDIKCRRDADNLLINTDIQSSLLQSLWPLLKPKGKLLYATCSILKEENQEQIALFLSKHKDAKVVPLKLDLGINTEFGLQILPGQGNMDGFFYALLEKTDHADD